MDKHVLLCQHVGAQPSGSLSWRPPVCGGMQMDGRIRLAAAYLYHLRTLFRYRGI